MAKKSKSKKKKPSSVQVFLKKMNIQKDEPYPFDKPILSKYDRLLESGLEIMDLHNSLIGDSDEDFPDHEQIHLPEDHDGDSTDHPDQKPAENSEKETADDLFDDLPGTEDSELLELLKKDVDEFEDPIIEDEWDDDYLFDDDELDDETLDHMLDGDLIHLRLWKDVRSFMDTSVDLSKELCSVNGEKVKAILQPYLEWLSSHKQLLNGKILCVGEYGYLTAGYLAANRPFSRIFWKGQEKADVAAELGLEELLFVNLPSAELNVKNLDYLMDGSEEKEGPYDVILIESQQQPWFAPRIDLNSVAESIIDFTIQEAKENGMDPDEIEALERLSQDKNKRFTDIEKMNTDPDFAREQRKEKAKAMAQKARQLLKPDGLLINIEYAPTPQALDEWADELSKNGLEALDIEKNRPIESCEHPGYMSIHTYRAPALADAKKAEDVQTLPDAAADSENDEEEFYSQGPSMTKLVMMIGSVIEAF